MNDHLHNGPHPVRDYAGFEGTVAEKASESVAAWKPASVPRKARRTSS